MQRRDAHTHKFLDNPIIKVLLELTAFCFASILVSFVSFKNTFMFKRIKYNGAYSFQHYRRDFPGISPLVLAAATASRGSPLHLKRDIGIRMISFLSSVLFGGELSSPVGSQTSNQQQQHARTGQQGQDCKRNEDQQSTTTAAVAALIVDPYKVLQVRRDATHAEIRHAYRR